MNLSMIIKIWRGLLGLKEIHLSFNILYHLGNVNMSAPGEA